LIRKAVRAHQARLSLLDLPMRFSWAQHQNVAQRLGAVDQEQLGVAVALMGVAMLMLAEDLIGIEDGNTMH
jgi:hypothetical protein